MKILLLLVVLLLISNSVSSIKYSTTPSSNLQTPTYLMINGGKKKDPNLFAMVRAFWLTLINPEVSIIININIIFIILF